MHAFDRYSGTVDGGREAKDAPREDIVPIPRGGEIMRASARGDDAEVVDLIEASPLEAWYGVPLDRLIEILDNLPPSATQESPVVRAFRLMLHSDPVESLSIGDDPHGLAEAASAYFDVRVHGEPERAAAIADLAGASPQRVNVLFDDTAGWRAFASVQEGIRALLAGDHVAALAAFADAKSAPPPRTLTVLLRDAYVKGGLIDALYGDPVVARRQLDIAATLPRTQSWAEPVVDSHVELAEAMLLAESDPAAAVERLERAPIPWVGELWPIRLLIIPTVYLRAGGLAAARDRVEELGRSAPAIADGYPHVAPAIARSILAFVDGDLDGAREALRIDPDAAMVETALLRTGLTLVEGDPDAALMEAIALHERTRGLRRFEVTRVLFFAWAQRWRGDEAAAVEALSGLVAEFGATMPFPPALPADLQRFALQRVPGWPTAVTLGRAGLAPAAPRLTPRERRLLPLLASGRTKEQIAADLFVSVNTVKSQQRTLFRKLGVSSRLDALVTAHRYRLI